MKNVVFIAPDLKRLEGSQAEAIALFCFEEKRPFRGITSLLDWRLLGHLSRLSMEGFLSGKEEETMLVPSGARLRQKHLLLFGLGDRDRFREEVFDRAIARMFGTAQSMKCKDMAVALPGRVEGVVDAASAIKWFVSSCEKEKGNRDVLIIEPQTAQKEMIPVVERWRLKRLMP